MDAPAGARSVRRKRIVPRLSASGSRYIDSAKSTRTLSAGILDQMASQLSASRGSTIPSGWAVIPTSYHWPGRRPSNTNCQPP